MDNLHQVMSAIQGEGKADASRANAKHIEVFREFLAHLDKVSRAPAGRVKTGSSKTGAKSKATRKSGSR